MEATYLEAADRLASVLFGGFATVLVACLLGRTALGRLRPLRGKLTEAEGWILAFAAGSALLSVVMFALCAARLFYDASAWVLGTAVTLAWLRWGRWTWPPETQEPTGENRPWRLLLLLPALAYGVLYAVHTLAPETRSDAVGYHLGFVQRYYRHHGFLAVPTSMYAQLSQGAEMLYLFAYSLGRESAAKIVHFSFLAGTVGGLLALARRHGAGRAGIFAAVAYFTCPVVIPDATSTYNDCALAFATLAAFATLDRWWRHRDAAWLGLLGLLIGFCFAIKFTGVVAAAAGLAAATGIGLRARSAAAALRGLALIGAVAAVVGLPWLAKNAVFVGNPLAPFFNHWFPNPHFSIEWETAYREAMLAYGSDGQGRWAQLLAAPLDLARGERYAGSIGWLFLLAPTAFLAWRRPLVWALLGAALIGGLPWFSNAGTRFLIPSLPFVALAMGLGLEQFRGRTRFGCIAALLAAQCITSWPAAHGRWYYEHLWSVEGFPWRAAVGLEPPKWHLARNLKFFLLADRLDKMDPERTRVLSFCNVPEAYFGAEMLVPYKGLENQDLADALLAPLEPERLPGSALRATWAGQPLRGIRIAQTRGHASAAWLVSEIRVLQDGEPLPSGAAWTVSARPLPWHARRLFDGDVFSLWNSREPPRPGMALEARFGDAMPVDGVELVHPLGAIPAQGGLAFFGLRDGPDWRELRPNAVSFQREDASRDGSRKAATAMLRRHGITHVVFDLDPADQDYYASARIIASDPKAWGLRRIFVDRTAVLYEVTTRCGMLEPARQF